MLNDFEDREKQLLEIRNKLNDELYMVKGRHEEELRAKDMEVENARQELEQEKIIGIIWRKK